MKETAKKITKVSLLMIGSLTLILLIWAGWVALKFNNIQKTEELSTIEELDTMFAEIVAEENIPGMAVAIVAQGDVVWAEGYGFANIDTQQPVTPDTPFLIS